MIWTEKENSGLVRSEAERENPLYQNTNFFCPLCSPSHVIDKLSTTSTIIIILLLLVALESGDPRSEEKTPHIRRLAGNHTKVYVLVCVCVVNVLVTPCVFCMQNRTPRPLEIAITKHYVSAEKQSKRERKESLISVVVTEPVESLSVCVCVCWVANVGMR